MCKGECRQLQCRNVTLGEGPVATSSAHAHIYIANGSGPLSNWWQKSYGPLVPFHAKVNLKDHSLGHQQLVSCFHSRCCLLCAMEDIGILYLIGCPIPQPLQFYMSCTMGLRQGSRVVVSSALGSY